MARERDTHDAEEFMVLAFSSQRDISYVTPHGQEFVPPPPRVSQPMPVHACTAFSSLGCALWCKGECLRRTVGPYLTRTCLVSFAVVCMHIFVLWAFLSTAPWTTCGARRRPENASFLVCVREFLAVKTIWNLASDFIQSLLMA